MDTEMNSEELLASIRQLGHTPESYQALIEGGGYTLVDSPAPADGSHTGRGYAYRAAGGVYEGHCIYGGAACIDWLIAEARRLGLVPMTTVDRSKYRAIEVWLRRKRGFVEVNRQGDCIILAIIPQ